MNNFYNRIPSEILYYIFSYIPLSDQPSLHRINIEFFVNYLQNIDKIKKIQKCFRQNRLNINMNFTNMTNKLFYRYYLIHYPLEYFIIYPEFMANKPCLDRRQSWQNYLDENTPPIETRKRSDVLKFFNNNQITVSEMMIAGW